MKQGPSTDLVPMAGRFSAGVSALTAGAKQAWNRWFGPMEPLTPVLPSQEAEDSGARGRQYDFPIGSNLRYKPRSEEPTRISFSELRGLADSYDLMRAVIETCKDEMESLEWSIRPKDVTKRTKGANPKPDARCQKITDFFLFPDKVHTWKQWQRAVLEDHFVIDAPCIYPRMTKGGELYSLDIVDGSTIKLLIDEGGRPPIPPNPAYQQILKGVPAAQFTREELIYHAHNYRSNHLYGYSQVEQVIMTVNIAIRRQLHQLQYYTAGSIPDMLLGVPETWNPDQIKLFQQYWDSIHEGNTEQRRHARFVPSGISKNVVMVKEAALKDDYDEWLARIICFFFNQAPTPFVKQMNRATSESSAEQAKEQGSKVTARFLADLITNRIIGPVFKAPDLEFAYKVDEDTNPVSQAGIDKIYLQEYVISPDEVRERQGIEGPAPEKPLPPAMGQPTGGTGDGSNNDGDGPKSGTVAGGAGKSSTVVAANKTSPTTDRKTASPSTNKEAQVQKADTPDTVKKKDFFRHY